MDETLFLSLINSDNITIIDLHNSFSVNEALNQLEKELFFLSKNKEKFAKIIYGVGSGTLKNEVVGLIKKCPLIKEYEIGGGGFCIVLL